MLKDILSIPPAVDRDITRLVLDSREIRQGDLFLAIAGTHLDGRRYIVDAIARGAAAVLIASDHPQAMITTEADVPIVPVHQLKALLGQLSASFFDYPAKKMQMIGITGTSGKTSCTHFIGQVLQNLSIPCGLIGTLGSGFYGDLHETGLTTPDAVKLQTTLHDLWSQGAKAISMEVSSHSIDQGRINAIDFDLGIFTNVSQDHLDYHGDMAAYAAVKRRFLAEFPIKQLIINVDDVHGQQWLLELAPTKKVLAYSTMGHAPIAPAIPLVTAKNVSLSLKGMHAVIDTPWGRGELSLSLIGQFNLSNALAALSALCLYGIPFETVLQQLAALKPVPGRMQTLVRKGKPLVVVDYAHKPDALAKALEALRKHTKGRLICVFGCGGERDSQKRPIMGKIAETLADRVIITNDNPRHEDPASIAQQILQGMINQDRVSVELDRSKAIKNSIQWAKENDCILIAGKGAEHYQLVGDKKLPFDDVDVALSCLDN
ncbi:MAG: UDP-N-acetylmuramoyl-L-alanyl-D-glutamate--2,6-diaminopimelate ligase [Gammaproteobacteria bacterium RIFCSPHIGHO2_12_FULL_43_28]|nr:MAG: UDP-N-acetylmuramoyl-L-alanyl-D-glutamate--2,6-diaminopimelate ligase [Gammaproteobacteria bacterium RIFCSPHIGHO2_12_FULL_43_28]